MLIALSGGADSVALLLHMHEQGLAEAAAHCNFHLRGEESNRDERFVRQLCEKYSIKLHVKHFDTLDEAKHNGESIEMAARRLRYEWFDHLCAKEGYEGVAVAHHQEDNAETILLNLVRGTGLRGLCGIQPMRGKVFRPLLSWTKQDILHFLDRHHQDYVYDSTNSDTVYKRNFIRHEVLPLLQKLNPQVVKTLCKMGERLTAVEAIYRQGLESLADKYREPMPLGWRLPMAALSENAAFAPTLLHEWLSPFGFTPTQIAEATSLRTGALLESTTHLLTRTRTHLELARRMEALSSTVLEGKEGEISLNNGYSLHYTWMDKADLAAIPHECHCAALDADSIQGTPCVRQVETADRFTPYGMNGSKLVSDYLTDRHRSRIEKMLCRAVADTKGILWLVNERPDKRVAVTEHTRRILLLQTQVESQAFTFD